jgi:neutral ceramidase
MMSRNRGALLAGAARIDITPEDLTGLTNLWRTPFEGIHDHIYVRALVVDNGINSAAIVAADLVEFGDTIELRKRIEQEIGIPVENIIITASHDHNAPRVGTTTPGATAQKGGPATASYTKEVYSKIIDALREAKAALQPARAGLGKGRADVNTNRNLITAEGWGMGSNPNGPSDKTVWVVKFESLAGEPLALLINYAVHSVFIGPENRLVTGDLAGAVERHVERSYQDNVVALWTIGPAGDQNPKYLDHDPGHRENEADYQLMDALGQILGEEVLQVAGRIERMNSEVRIEAAERVVSCPARIPPRDAKRPGMEVEQVDSLDIRLGLILLDHVALTWVSGEVVTRIYWHLQQESPFSNTIMVTLANDRVGYIVDDAGYHTPTFESTASPFQRGHAEPAVVNGLVEMMSRY